VASRGWAGQAILIGLAGIVLGRIPSWAAGLPLTLQSSFDRFTVSMMIGGSLLMAGLVELSFRGSRWRLGMASLLVALGVGQQFYNANIFRRDWERQREIYWQFAWRAPATTPGTLLLTDQLEIDYETDYSLTAPINWMYAPNFRPPRLPYLVLGVEERPGWQSTLEPGSEFDFAYRPVRFYGSTSRVVAFLMPPSSCLRILDPVYDSETINNKFSPEVAHIIQLSEPLPILANAPAPQMPEAVFGKEPPHTWCYYYASAELARQRGDWEMVAQLGDKARQMGFSPSDPVEWFPFVEAYAYSGQSKDAENLSRLMLKEKPSLRKGLCELWGRVEQKQALPSGLLVELGCQ
jgi:hypothetical protein